MTSPPRERTWTPGLLVLGVVTAVVVVLGALEVTRIINARTEDRVVAERVTADDVRENRRILDELVCELRALRESAVRQGMTFPDIPQTAPRRLDEVELQCPPLP